MGRAVIFDIDGTLYRPNHFALRLIASDPFHICMLARERICRKRLQGREFACSKDYYDTLFSLMGRGSSRRAERCRKWFWEIYLPAQVRIIREQFKARPHIVELILKLRKDGWLVAVLSDYGLAAEKLKACGLENLHFDAVLESPDAGGLKPCPRTFLNVCEHLGIEPQNALMIGDKVSTDGGALDAGLQFIHLIEKESQRGCDGPAVNDMLWSEILDFFHLWD